MTLVLYIPYSDGCLLIADRQDTTVGTTKGICKKEVTKLHLVTEKGPAIGCAGNTEFFQSLFEKLKEQENINNDNVIRKLEEELLPEVAKQWKMMYGEYGHPLGDVEMIVITYKNGEIVPFYMHGLSKRSIERNRCDGIGDGLTATGFLLNYDTKGLSEEAAVSWGEEILRRVALVNYTVAPRNIMDMM